MRDPADHNSYRVVNFDKRGSYHVSDLTVENVRRELKAASAALTMFSRSEIPASKVKSLTAVYDAIRHLDRWLPEIEGWCCGYYWGSGGTQFSCFSAHIDEEDAKRWLKFWEQAPGARTEWIIEYRPAGVTEFREGGPPPGGDHDA